MRAPPVRSRSAAAIASLALGLAQACGGATPASAGLEDDGYASDHSGEESGVVSASRCPERFGGSIPCEGGDDPGTCTYPEGTCACREPVWCGGAAPPPMPRTWTCEAPQPPCPTPGTPCTGAGSCSVGPCGFDSIVCVDGVWTPRIGPRPP